MKQVLSVENMRKSDAFAVANGVSVKELMFRAGKGVFENADWKSPVAVVCGSGNNGGDGYVLAKLLKQNGFSCKLFLLTEKFSEEGLFFFRQCLEENIEYAVCGENTRFDGFATVADCIFGTGFSGKTEGLARKIIEAVNESGAYVVSVDINSGLNGNNGLGDVCVVSDRTVAVGGFKYGHFLNRAKDVMKSVVCCDVGIRPVEPPCFLAEKEDFLDAFPVRLHFSHKGDYGYAALIGGSVEYSGAIRLAHMANAAMRSGAGVVKIAAPKSLCPYLIPNILESTLFPLSDSNGRIVFQEREAETLAQSVGTIAFGMGIGVGEQTTAFLRYLLERFEGTLLVDADGLTALSEMPEKIRRARCSLVLTPHLGEFARLTRTSVQDILRDPVQRAKTFAAENNVVLLLKGPTTVVTDGKTTYLVNAGCAGMATAGSGDVLSGIATATCANRRSDTLFAAALAAYVNGKAGEYAQEQVNATGMIAGDTVAQIARVVGELSAH